MEKIYLVENGDGELMSAYVNFFVKHKNDDKFIHIGDYSRNSEIYAVFEDFVPYEKIVLVTPHILGKAQERIKEKYEATSKAIDSLYEKLDFVEKVTGVSLEAKISEYDEIKELIEDGKDELDCYSAALCRTYIIEDIMSYPDNEVYAGIECYEPTEEDIK